MISKLFLSLSSTRIRNFVKTLKSSCLWIGTRYNSDFQDSMMRVLAPDSRTKGENLRQLL